jgi:hypothetical protein
MRKWLNRLRAAWNVLRGRPTAYGLRLGAPLSLEGAGPCAVIGCHVRRV